MQRSSHLSRPAEPILEPPRRSASPPESRNHHLLRVERRSAEATIPEIRLAVAEPELDVGNVETALEALSTTCYYLSAEKNRYRFSLSPNQDLHVLVEWRGNEIGR